MSRRCDCHRKMRAAMVAGASFEDAYGATARPGYHEHRCECACGCKRDSLGYAYCVACHWDHGPQRREARLAYLAAAGAQRPDAETVATVPTEILDAAWVAFGVRIEPDDVEAIAAFRGGAKP